MADPLPSWREGAAKAAILDFVARVTGEGGADFLAPAERIATFDNDGTLWCEQPMQVQGFFAHDQLLRLAEADPGLKDREPFKSYLAHDLAGMKQLGKQGLFEIAAATHAGVTQEAFDAIARDWLTTAKHPTLGKLFVDLTYQPQIELIAFLKANGFLCFIVSGGGLDLMRGFSEEVYGIARHQVVGSSVKTRFELQDGKAQLVKLAELQSFDDREVKPVNIGLHIGRRPVLAFGNSDGDLAMLRYVLSGEGPRLGLLLHHDDAEQEFAYDRAFRLSPLAEALDKAGAYGIRVVSMKADWGEIFRTGGGGA